MKTYDANRDLGNCVQEASKTLPKPWRAVWGAFPERTGFARTAALISCVPRREA